MCIASAASLLAAGTVMAQEQHFPDLSSDNPENLPLTETRVGVQNVVSLLEKNQPAHAADENLWFRSPSVFSEYTYTDTFDKRADGFTSHMRNGTVGLNFLTICDVAMSLMGTYGGTAADTDTPGHIVNNADTYGLTLSAAKNIDWFLMGASASYNDGYSHTHTPSGNIKKDLSDGTTIAPFVGAMYVNGNLSLSTVPTYMFGWNHMDYDSTGPTTSDDHAMQQTFVWMNTASYNVSEQVTVGVVANWNRVTHVKRSLTVPPVPADREWVTLGPKVAYHFSPDLSVYASCNKDIFSSSFRTVQAVAGLNYGF